MSPALVKVTREVLDLPEHERRALADFLLQTEEDYAAPDDAARAAALSPQETADIEQAWDKEIRNRIQDIDNALARGETPGIPLAEVRAGIDEMLANRRQTRRQQAQ